MRRTVAWSQRPVPVGHSNYSVLYSASSSMLECAYAHHALALFSCLG